MKQKVILILALFIMVLLAGCNSNQGSDKTIAEVNGKKITQGQFDERYVLIKANFESMQGSKVDESKDKEMLKNLQEATYNNLILQELLAQEGKKQGLAISDKDVDTSLNAFKEAQNQYSSDGYSKFLNDMKMTEKQLRQEINNQLLSMKIQDKVTGNLTVSDDEVKKYYNDNQDQFKDAGGIQIYHILVKEEKQAQDILAKLKTGEDFSKLAGEYSIDPGSKTKGGDLGVVNESTNFVPEFKQAALALKPGEFTAKPVKSEFGYHIIKAGEKKGPSLIPFEQAKTQIKTQLEKDKKDKAFNTYLEQLKKNAEIKDLRKK